MRTSIALLGLALAVGLAVVRPASAQENTLSEYEKKAGWKLLFDGQTTKGWRNFKKDAISDGWKVVDGALTRASGGAGDIITQEQFDSFELSIEYKISPEGNSGIMFHVTEDEDTPWKTGPELQVQDNEKGHDPQKAGWLYQLYKPGTPWGSDKPLDATRPVGEWNHIQLLVTPQICEINVNGMRYAQFQKGSPDWNERVAKSKFNEFKNFGKPTKGFISLQDHGNPVAYRNIKIRTLGPKGEAPEPIDGTLALKVEPAFPNLTWSGWSPEGDDGKPKEFRAITIMNSGDGTNRLFVGEQRGTVYAFPNDPNAGEAQVFLDIRDRVSYKDRENEEGFLGMAFHPKFKENGEVFVYYTSSKLEPHTSVISRFKTKADNPNQVDPASEQELLRIPQPFWNHNGGTIVFGPDGYLYVGLGDGGAANDPYGNGQNLSTLLGSILRIDVDHKDNGKNYAIPKDNPFVGKEGAAPEIFAIGLRNVWRMSFDRKSGAFWVADVGQNLWEEINIVTKGGNYGWGIREASHPFGPKGSSKRDDLTDPIWEYDHRVGFSITGGHVYRGTAFPELEGKYIYADFVTGKIWALKYDDQAKKVVSNEAIPSIKYPVMSFGEDEKGEIYFLIASAKGQSMFRFAK